MVAPSQPPASRVMLCSTTAPSLYEDTNDYMMLRVSAVMLISYTPSIISIVLMVFVFFSHLRAMHCQLLRAAARDSMEERSFVVEISTRTCSSSALSTRTSLQTAILERFLSIQQLITWGEERWQGPTSTR